MSPRTRLCFVPYRKEFVLSVRRTEVAAVRAGADVPAFGAPAHVAPAVRRHRRRGGLAGGRVQQGRADRGGEREQRHRREPAAISETMKF